MNRRKNREIQTDRFTDRQKDGQINEQTEEYPSYRQITRQKTHMQADRLLDSCILLDRSQRQANRPPNGHKYFNKFWIVLGQV